MKLNKNIVRINGRKDGHKTHIDVEVRMHKVLGKDAPYMTAYDFNKIGFDAGFEAVNSINYYNFVGDRRLTEKIS